MTLERHEKAIETCTYCPSMCSHACPVGEAEAREAVTPQAKMVMLGSLVASRRPFSAENASVLHACTGCGLCTRFCEHGVDVATALFDGRAAAAARGAGPKALGALSKRFFRRAARRRRLFRSRAVLGAATTELACLPACAPGDGADFVGRDRAVYRRFGMGDVPVADLPHACAGYPLWAGGRRADLRRVVEETARALAGVRTLVSGCAACVWLMRRVYPDLGVRLRTRVVHATEILDARTDRVRFARRHRVAVYHDACYLGRHLGVFEPPRRLAAACVDSLADLPESREWGPCSGGGGLVPITAPGTTQTIADRRHAVVREADAHLLITACPTACRTLAVHAPGLRVVELMDLLAEATESG